MIVGQVNSRLEAIVPLRVRGPGGIELDLKAVLDSGYTGSLTLSAETIAALALVRQSGGMAMLADRSTRPFDIFAAEVAWDGGWRPVLVTAVGGETLLGMRLLRGRELRIEVEPGGTVAIAPLPATSSDRDRKQSP